jgi:hypothetical protein
VKGLVQGVKRRNELDAQHVIARSGNILDPEPFITGFDQLVSVDPTAAT